jgi:hypothetical protein
MLLRLRKCVNSVVLLGGQLRCGSSSIPSARFHAYPAGPVGDILCRSVRSFGLGATYGKALSRLCDVAVAQIRGARTFLDVLLFERGKAIEPLPGCGRLICVHPCRVAVKNGGFHRTVGGTERLEPEFFCRSSGISMRRRPSICHCGEPVHSASVPHTT